MESNVQQDPFLVHRQHAAELFLIRHGDAIPEADEIIPSGVYDNLPLSKIGRQQEGGKYGNYKRAGKGDGARSELVKQ